MKIAIVAGHDLNESPRIRWEAATLVAAGHRVTVYGTLSASTEAEDDAQGVVYVRVPLRGWRAGTGLAHPVRVARWFERLEPVVRTAVTRERPEALHAHGLEVAAPARAAAADLGIPLVHEVEGVTYADRLAERRPAKPADARSRARGAAVSLLLRKAASEERRLRDRPGLAATVADTDALADDIERRHGGPRPLVVRSCPPLGTQGRTDALRRRLDLPRSARLVALSGPLADGCGVETAVRALPLLAERYVLVLVSAAPRLARFERLADELGVASRVRFVPPAPADETAGLLASADAALVPTEPSSVANRTAIPPRLFAALHAGLPVVASDTRSVGEIVRRTGAGVLYPARSPQDPAALAEGIHTLLADRSLAATCADAARHAVRTQLNWETESRKLVDLYDELGSGR